MYALRNFRSMYLTAWKLNRTNASHWLYTLLVQTRCRRFDIKIGNFLNSRKLEKETEEVRSSKRRRKQTEPEPQHPDVEDNTQEVDMDMDGDSEPEATGESSIICFRTVAAIFMQCYCQAMLFVRYCFLPAQNLQCSVLNDLRIIESFRNPIRGRHSALLFSKSDNVL